MQDFLDRVPGEGKKNRKKITHEDGTVEYAIIESADEPVQTGTPINRVAMMALQGFEALTTERTPDGDILQTNAKKQTLLTHRNKDDGSIIQTFTGETVAKKTITKQNGKIIEKVIL